MILYIILLFISKYALFKSLCIEGIYNCIDCNPLTKLCNKCIKNIYIPDDIGGCQNSKKCFAGKNYCIKCNSEGKLCQTCEDSYFPDLNGGCAYTTNCEISEKGKCIKCLEDFILIGEDNYFNQGIKICKSTKLTSLKNCLTINMSTGKCIQCEEGYFLGEGDEQCSPTQFCSESIFGVCTKCNFGYYLNKKEAKCEEQKDNFEHCKETIDSKTCFKCEEDYYFDEYGKCIEVNFCKKGNKFKCEECNDGFFLSSNRDACTNTENCLFGDKDLRICLECDEGYYINYKDGKCVSNIEDNEFKYCKKAEDDMCTQCIDGYELGRDNKCSKTKYCMEAFNGECIECIDNYYLGLDKMCTNVQHCIYSDYYNCIECEDNYFYDFSDKICKLTYPNFENCKSGYENGFCYMCKEDFYLNQTDNICYINTDYGKFYKCEVTDTKSEHCAKCIEGYYLGIKDFKCNKVDGCIESENLNKCLECYESYCLDIKTGQCIYNDEIVDENKIFYYRCNKTNEEGNKCQICIDGFIADENGLCVDIEHCEEKNENGKCLKCFNKYCLNEYFECQEVNYYNCLECNDVLNLGKCTKCYKGFELDEYYRCLKIQE